MDSSLEDFGRLTTAQLTERWRSLSVRGDPPRSKQAVARGIAWHIQSQLHGGLDAETRRRLKLAIRRAPAPEPKTTRRTQRESIRLRTGTTLIRTWRGRKHEVTVLDEGKAFRYRDSEYASLSEIAREITGARWSGPRFFGLKKLTGSA
ncbi:MAG: DUF2924 domain-containing protein [Planctomycetota bacterium]